MKKEKYGSAAKIVTTDNGYEIFVDAVKKENENSEILDFTADRKCIGFVTLSWNNAQSFWIDYIDEVQTFSDALKKMKEAGEPFSYGKFSEEIDWQSKYDSEDILPDIRFKKFAVVDNSRPKTSVEDVQGICDALCLSLQGTRAQYDLSEIKYVPKEESVYLVYHGSCNFKKKINVECCSGFGIVKAVINSL